MTPKELKPLNGRILIEILDLAVEFNSILDMSRVTMKQPKVGVVLSQDNSSIIKIGDKIVIMDMAGVPIPLSTDLNNNTEYRLIKEEEILCKVIGDVKIKDREVETSLDNIDYVLYN